MKTSVLFSFLVVLLFFTNGFAGEEPCHEPPSPAPASPSVPSDSGPSSGGGSVTTAPSGMGDDTKGQMGMTFDPSVQGDGNDHPFGPSDFMSFMR
ncbi:MAG: hypothetical protein HY877_01795, partial [Deltaproteobacteria bacterium]|nr:hypothetical protein [Deltaproteobacteria bacterium]